MNCPESFTTRSLQKRKGNYIPNTCIHNAYARTHARMHTHSLTFFLQFTKLFSIAGMVLWSTTHVSNILIMFSRFRNAIKT